MSDTRPSIAELQVLDARQDLTTDELLQIASALGPLLEIAVAALERQRAMAALESVGADDWDQVERANLRIAAALAKVRT